MDKKILFSIIVAALGYFVDVYDLIVFSVVRMASLKDLGLTGDDLTNTGVFLLNTQLAGMLIGGVFWGILGDRKGRLSILFGSILLYSLANIANAFVTDVWQYAACRFVAGLGLAGEIGAGITLVSELLPKEKRGIGTTIVATLGVLGGFTASIIGDFFHWQTAYIVGGCMGLALLALRVVVSESGMFRKMEDRKSVRRGDLRLLLGSPARLARYVFCILIALPLWFIVGLILTFSPEIGKEIGIDGVKTSGSILWFYGGLAVGDLGSGLLSQKLKSRKKVLWLFIGCSFIGTMLLLNLPVLSAEAFYWVCGVTGIFCGYWAVFLTTTAEQFGTNLRATVTTSVPNFVRGGTILLSSMFALLKGNLGVIASLEIIAVATFAAAAASLYLMRETFGIDLDYMED